MNHAFTPQREAARNNAYKIITEQSRMLSKKSANSFYAMLTARPNRRTVKTNYNIATGWENNAIEKECLSSYVSEPDTNPFMKYPIKRKRTRCNTNVEEPVDNLTVPRLAIATSASTQKENIPIMTMIDRQEERAQFLSKERSELSISIFEEPPELSKSNYHKESPNTTRFGGNLLESFDWKNGYNGDSANNFISDAYDHEPSQHLLHLSVNNKEETTKTARSNRKKKYLVTRSECNLESFDSKNEDDDDFFNEERIDSFDEKILQHALHLSRMSMVMQ